MSEMKKENKVTAADRLRARLLEIAPWLAPFVLALPGPLLFTLLYLTTSTTEAAALFVFLGFLSFALGAGAGLIAALMLFFYRRKWFKRMREKLALNGITADEVSWFAAELTTAERQALKEIEERNLLLADAYRETLAARLTATRVVNTARRELLLVERRLNRSAYRQGQTNQTLQLELHADRERLSRVKQEAAERRSEAEARLQMIEAAASRGANWDETNAALQRLNSTQQYLPIALESARLEQQVREDVEQEVREMGTGDKQASN